jgi:hypothetical protein
MVVLGPKLETGEADWRQFELQLARASGLGMSENSFEKPASADEIN